MRVTDVGCYTGGLSCLMAKRAAQVFYAVDEIRGNLAQCEFLRETFGLSNVQPLLRTVYRLPDGHRAILA